MLEEKVLRKLLSELKLGLQTLYGHHLKGVYLYGSYARGEQEEGSDVDVLIVLDRIDHYASEVHRTGQLGSDLSLRYGASICKVFYSEQEWLTRNSSFLSSVREEAQAA